MYNNKKMVAKDKKDNKSMRLKKIYQIIFLFIVIIGFITLCLWGRAFGFTTSSTHNDDNVLSLGIATQNGGLQIGSELSEEELNKLYSEMEQKVKESEIAFMVNSSPVLNQGQMNIMFESPSNNVNLLTFYVVLDETGEVIYETKEALLPNSSIEFCDVSKELSVGNYKASVIMTSYHIDTLEKIGQAIVGINIQAI